jgi:hypothetical protein
VGGRAGPKMGRPVFVGTYQQLSALDCFSDTMIICWRKSGRRVVLNGRWMREKVTCEGDLSHVARWGCAKQVRPSRSLSLRRLSGNRGSHCPRSQGSMP